MKNYLQFAIITFVISFFACAKTHSNSINDNAGTTIPDCIETKIKFIQRMPVRNPPGSIWQYDYKGQKVYFIPAYCCDMYSELYDSNCNLVCHPDGGITGGGDGLCKDFFKERKNGVLIWEDDRK